MAKQKQIFIAFEKNGDWVPVWNSDNQSFMFPSLKAVKQGIDDEIEEQADYDVDEVPEFVIYELTEVV